MWKLIFSIFLLAISGYLLFAFVFCAFDIRLWAIEGRILYSTLLFLFSIFLILEARHNKLHNTRHDIIC